MIEFTELSKIVEQQIANCVSYDSEELVCSLVELNGMLDSVYTSFESVLRVPNYTGLDRIRALASVDSDAENLMQELDMIILDVQPMLTELPKRSIETISLIIAKAKNVISQSERLKAEYHLCYIDEKDSDYLPCTAFIIEMDSMVYDLTFILRILNDSMNKKGEVSMPAAAGSSRLITTDEKITEREFNYDAYKRIILTLKERYGYELPQDETVYRNLCTINKLFKYIKSNYSDIQFLIAGREIVCPQKYRLLL